MHLPEPKSSGGDWAIAPEGVHQAVCVSIIDLGTQEEIDNFNGGALKKVHKIQVRWELPHELMPDGNFKGQPFTLTKRYTFSTHEKANFRKDLESWRGKKFTDADFGAGGFQINKLLGVNCQLNVIHKPKKDGSGTRAEIAGIMPLGRGMQKAEPHMAPFLLSLHADDFDRDLYDGLTDGMRSTIAKAPEFQALLAQRDAIAAPPPAMNGGAVVMDRPTLSADLDDEIPF
jgi:hypothetical protein